MTSDERSQATGSKEGLLPKVDETKQMVGSSKDTARRLAKAADGTPLPKDDDEDSQDVEENAGKDLDGKVVEKNRGKELYGKADRRGIRKKDHPIDMEVGLSPEQHSGQATNRSGKVDGKAGKLQGQTIKDDDEEIPEGMLPLIDEEVEYVEEFIQEEVERRLKELEDQDDHEKDKQTKKMYEEQKEKMKILEERMKVIHEKDEKLKKYIAGKRLHAEKEAQAKKDIQNSDALINSGRESQKEKIRQLEKQLDEERKRREFLEKQWTDTQYDEAWDSDKDGWDDWHYQEEETPPKEPSKESSYEVVSPIGSLKLESEDEPSEFQKILKVVMDQQQKNVEMVLKQAKGSGQSDLLDQEDQRIKIVELESLKEPNEESASIMCGDWLHRIKPVIKNMSKRASRYWTRLEEVVEERYTKFLRLSPVERLKQEPIKDAELGKEEYTRVKAIIMEMILKAIPKELATEATQKRFEEPTEVLLMVMTKYQPGSRQEKERLLQQISNPEVGWTIEQSLVNLKLWKRRIERAEELKLTVPDPAILLSSLDAITEKVLSKDHRQKFRIESAREDIKVDIITSKEAVEKLALILEGELEQSVSSNITPKVKAVSSEPKGKGKDGKGKDGKGKDGKGKDGKGKDGKGKDGKGKDKSKDPCYFFTETEEGCKHGQQCARYHRMLKPEEKRRYVCGSTKHMANERDRPKKEDPKGSSKGEKGN